MTDIIKLIQVRCPDGVEYHLLEDICEIPTTRIEASRVDTDTYVSVENLLPDKAGKTIADHVPTNCALIEYHANDILIGNIRPYLKKIWLAATDGGTNGDVIVVRPKSERSVHPKYLYYVLSSDVFFSYFNQTARGSKMPRGDKARVMKYRVPLPPPEFQQEIVSVLDRLTELNEMLRHELANEIELREKQYEYCRDFLLSFPEKEV